MAGNDNAQDKQGVSGDLFAFFLVAPLVFGSRGKDGISLKTALCVAAGGVALYKGAEAGYNYWTGKVTDEQQQNNDNHKTR